MVRRKITHLQTNIKSDLPQKKLSISHSFLILGLLSKKIHPSSHSFIKRKFIGRSKKNCFVSNSQTCVTGLGDLTYQFINISTKFKWNSQHLYFVRPSSGCARNVACITKFCTFYKHVNKHYFSKVHILRVLLQPCNKYNVRAGGI